MQQAVRAETELNTDLNQIFDTIDSFYLAKSLGFSLASAELFYDALLSMSDQKEDIMKQFYEFGEWMIRFCEIRYQDINERINSLIQFMRNSFWRDLVIKIWVEENNVHCMNVIKRSMDFSDILLNYYCQTFIAIFEHLGFKKIEFVNEISHIRMKFRPEDEELKRIIELRAVKPTRFFINENDVDHKKPNRKTLAINKEIAETLLQIAKKRKMTLFNYVNELVLKKCLKIHQQFNKSIEEIVTEYSILNIIKNFDLILVPTSIYREAIKNKIEKSKEWIEKWYEEGIRHSKRAKVLTEMIKAGNKNSFPVEQFQQLINQVFFTDVSGFKIEIIPHENELFFRIIGTSIEPEVMRCIARYYEALFNEWGYDLDENKKIISLGVCSLRFIRK
ncbi:MAG: hypothetical protein ACTSVY_07500 [Candidatus Helarchaeota archaeon]